MKKEKFYLFCLKSIPGLKEALTWEYLKNGFLPSELYHSPPPAIKYLLEKAKFDPDFKAKIRQEFPLYQNALCILDEEYPKLLKTIFDPPLFLFYQGNLALLQSEYLVTVVGSRTLSFYHQHALEKILADCRQTPLVITSGLAIGIDTLAHEQALANNLATIAVLGSGFAKTVFYPKNNFKLGQQILKHKGLILSEYPPETKPNLYQFPQRNRILAGLSKATLVISGTLKSGTLITAQCALDNGREVFALPGNINQTLNEGPNDLINQGAQIFLNADSLLKTYDLITLKQEINLDLDQNQELVYQTLQIEALSTEDLQTKLNFELATLTSVLSQLELKNLIQLNYFNQWEIKC